MIIIIIIIMLIYNYYCFHRSECHNNTDNNNDDSLVFVSEFQPINDQYNPIKGDNIMESYILKNSLLGTTATSYNKRYNVGHIISSACNKHYTTGLTDDNDADADHLDGDGDIRTMRNEEYEKLIRFTSKPWQYLYDAMKGRSTRNSIDTTSHCFVISVLEPYYSGNLIIDAVLCYDNIT
jgi:hypothetical protein